MSRLGPDDVEATKRSGELWRGDAEMLETLPQGKAKLATLRVREIMASRKPKTTGHLAAVVTRKADNDSGEPPTKKPCTLAAKTGSAETGVPEHALSVAGVSAMAQREPRRETGAAGLVPELVPGFA